jgi:hypothetical protein
MCTKPNPANVTQQERDQFRDSIRAMIKAAMQEIKR